MDILPNIKEKLALLPNNPGVYIMKNAQGEIIYVGKAIVLKNRVRSYFQAGSNATPKVRVMVAQIVDLEYIVTANEVEALILESNLIKKHRPRYNIMLKDDKSYPYIKLTLQEEFPRVFITRKLIKDGAKYFGPYTSAGAVHQTLKLLKKIFPLRSCRKMDSKRPCLEYHIKRCLAPCSGNISKEDYDQMVQGVNLFLEGRSDLLLKQLKVLMQEASKNMHYEEAAGLRDQINSIEILRQQQTAVTIAGDVDVVGMAIDEQGVCAQVFFVRAGKVVGRDHFLLTANLEDNQTDILTAFIQQYYNKVAFIPKEIILPIDLPASEITVLSDWLSSLKKQRVQLLSPKRGLKKDLLDLANENAAILLKEENELRQQKENAELKAVNMLQDALGLEGFLHRIDCFDISHIQGAETVASMVVFKDGKESKKDYRRFKLKTVEGKPDDFKSMQEVVLRRYSKYEDLPDLIVIDGGKGQLSSALEVIRGLGLEMPVIGLAKKMEEIFQEGISESLLLSKDSPAIHLLQRIRDEAHRFAITYHRKLRSKRNMVSVLDNIPGIGENRRKALWQKFNSIQAIKEADVEELSEVPGINKSVAEAIHRYFRLSEEGFK